MGDVETMLLSVIVSLTSLRSEDRITFVTCAHATDR